MPQVLMGPRYVEREQLSSPYIVRDLQLQNEDTKQIQRDRVLKHMDANHANKRAKLFSLPAAWWSFECQFERAFLGAQFVAVERTYEIFRHGITFMPGKGKHRVRETLKTGDLHGHWSDTAKILWCEASTFVNTGRAELMDNARSMTWRNTYGRWTCAWWDFTSQTCREVIESLVMTEKHLDHQVDVCPVSITIIPAREERPTIRLMNNVVPENVDANERRVLFLERWLNRVNQKRRVEVVDYFPYESAGGCPMLLINTLFVRKEEAA